MGAVIDRLYDMHKPFAPYATVDPMIGADSGYAFGGFIFEGDAVPISRTHFESHCDGIRKISNYATTDYKHGWQPLLTEDINSINLIDGMLASEDLPQQSRGPSKSPICSSSAQAAPSGPS